MPTAKPKLDPVGMLSDEFNYVAGTAAQANEDRARVLSFYMVTVASLLGAILGVQLAPSSGLYYAFASLFALLSLFGLLTLLQLIRLRQAWFDSATAMNAIKEYYIEKYPDLARAITWRMHSKPRRINFWSIGFLQALQVGLLGSVTLGAAIYFLSAAWEATSVPISLGVGAGFLLFQIWLYHFRLNERKPKP